MSDVQLRLSGISRAYKEGQGRLVVLDDANIEVRSGELVALVAPSGAGKSTLLHLCGLLERPDAGEVELCGGPTSALGDRARTMLRRNMVGYVYQFHHLLPEFTALENVIIPQLIAGAAERDATRRAQDLLDLLGVGPRAAHRPAELSGGEQQRVAIARAAANNPRVILADEPTGNLDPATSTLVFETLAEFVRTHGAGALVATHNHDLARRADRIVTLKDGRIVPAQL